MKEKYGIEKERWKGRGNERKDERKRKIERSKS